MTAPKKTNVSMYWPEHPLADAYGHINVELVVYPDGRVEGEVMRFSRAKVTP